MQDPARYSHCGYSGQPASVHQAFCKPAYPSNDLSPTPSRAVGHSGVGWWLHISMTQLGQIHNKVASASVPYTLSSPSVCGLRGTLPPNCRLPKGTVPQLPVFSKAEHRVTTPPPAPPTPTTNVCAISEHAPLRGNSKFPVRSTRAWDSLASGGRSMNSLSLLINLAYLMGIECLV